MNSSQPGGNNALDDPFALTLMLNLKKMNVCDLFSFSSDKAAEN